MTPELPEGQWLWPLIEGPCEWPGPEGQFGAVRKHDIHTGIDLYTYPGMPALAVEDGRIVAIEDFTGPKAGSPWWEDTQAVLIEGVSGVVCYGELTPLRSVKIGERVKQGTCLGCVKRVLRRDKGRPMTMLHLELYRPGTRESVWWRLGAAQPAELLDPTGLLRGAFEREREQRQESKLPHKTHVDRAEMGRPRKTLPGQPKLTKRQRAVLETLVALDNLQRSDIVEEKWELEKLGLIKGEWEGPGVPTAAGRALC